MSETGMNTKVDIEEVSAQAIKWSETHNDPAATLILVAKDGTHFRVSPWYMAKKSAFVRDMLASASTGSLDESPIPTETSPEGLSLYIDMIYGKSPPDDICTTPITFEVIRLAARMLSPDIDHQFSDSAKRGDPWQCFVFAAQLNDLELARYALRQLDDGWHIDRVTGSDIKLLPPSWLAGLLYSRLWRAEKCLNDCEGIAMCHEISKWVRVAGSFSPRD